MLTIKTSGLFMRSLALLLAATTQASIAIATDIRTAEQMMNNARNAISAGKYADAYREVEWLIHDESSVVRDRVAEFLRSQPRTVLVALDAMSDDMIKSLVCEVGPEKARSSLAADLKFLAAVIPQDTEQFIKAKTRVDVFLASPVSDVNSETCRQAAENLAKTKTIEEQAALAEEIKQAPARLRALNPDSFCQAYGQVIRDESLTGYGPATSLEATFGREADRRNLTINKDLVRRTLIKIGMNRCTLLASWGEPSGINRSVGSWGINEQFVYGRGLYVYITNSRVTSFQD